MERSVGMTPPIPPVQAQGFAMKPPSWVLEIPQDASLEDVIRVINNLKIVYTAQDGKGEQGLFDRWGPLAVYFRRVG